MAVFEEPNLAKAPGSDLDAVVEARDLRKIYMRGAEEVRALDGVSLRVNRGEFAAITGPSGAGKTTLLQLIGAMDTPTSGSLEVAGQSLVGLADRELTRLRRRHIGFVFQHFSLLPTLSVAENVALPALLDRRESGKRVDQLLEQVGLAHRKNHRPSQLSGGEMQRVAIARALVNSPNLLLADEPTGNLDFGTSNRILDLLHDLHRDGLTIIVVTHSSLLSQAVERVIEIRDGKIVTSP